MVLGRLFSRINDQNPNLVDIDQDVVQPIIDRIDDLSNPNTFQSVKDLCNAIIRDFVITPQRSLDEVNACERLGAVVSLLRDLSTDKPLEDAADAFKARVVDSKAMAALFRVRRGLNI
jgi:hypothetical protein